jgi:hypothetical protein
MTDLNLTKLGEPFPPERVEWRAGSTNQDKSKALALAYIDSRAVMDRFDDAVGPENWQNDYRTGPDGGVLAGIGIRIGGEWVWKWDGAENSDFEGVKGGLSDSFKRAAVKWGIGRYLYDVPAIWVDCEQRGKTVVLKSKPKLPDWAMPKAAKPTPPTGTSGNGNGKVQQPTGKKETEPPATDELRQKPEELKLNLIRAAAGYKSPNVQPADLQPIAPTLEMILGGEAQRKELLHWLFGKNSLSKGKPEYVGDANVLALARWLKPSYDRDNHVFTCDPMAEREAKAAHVFALSINQGTLATAG